MFGFQLWEFAYLAVTYTAVFYLGFYVNRHNERKVRRNGKR